MDVTSERQTSLRELAQRLGVPNVDLGLLHEALCHSSFANENTDCSTYGNERLEFLGDSVVGLAVTEALYLGFPGMREGDLSKIKSIIVSKRILSERTEELGLGDYLLLGKGEEQTGGRSRFSILGNLFESVVGAIYLSEGIDIAKQFVLRQVGDELDRAAVGESIIDYKSDLQERTQKEFGVLPIYRLVHSTGPDHDREFVVQVLIGENVLSEGSGKSKKKAEKAAAQNALKRLESDQIRPVPEPFEVPVPVSMLTPLAETPLPTCLAPTDLSKPRGAKPLTAIPREGRILAIDLGEKRIGVALSDQLRTIAQPLVTMKSNRASTLVKDVTELIREHEVSVVVVGLPRTLDGKERESAATARKLADRLQRSLSMPVILWDERLSTVGSERHLIESGVRRRDRRDVIDQCAAAWILEGYLEYLRQNEIP
ncbi:MAG TPA: ribonuclease III [bacterium]|mgnify:CR=1 FL=1|nr:ribonuclease III [bacterium]HQP97383.1 ribonuclease III [bacterium]